MQAHISVSTRIGQSLVDLFFASLTLWISHARKYKALSQTKLPNTQEQRTRRRSALAQSPPSANAGTQAMHAGFAGSKSREYIKECTRNALPFYTQAAHRRFTQAYFASLKCQDALVWASQKKSSREENLKQSEKSRNLKFLFFFQRLYKDSISKNHLSTVVCFFTTSQLAGAKNHVATLSTARPRQK